MKKKIILDCDTGIDDALAVMYLALTERAELIAAGTVHGNVPAATSARNTLRVLEVCGRPDVPVAMGAVRPLAQPLDTSERVHGQDGMGDTNQPLPSGQPIAGSAAEQMVRLAREAPGSLSIVATGPFTNLALALMLEPELPRLVPEVVVMGGNAHIPGNITSHAEANVWHDPEAAELVFGAGWHVTMIGLDVTMKALLEAEDQERVAASAKPSAQLAWAILQHYLDVYQLTLGRRACALHDPLAAAVALDASLVTCVEAPVHVDLRGDRLRGTTIVDLRAKPKAVGPPTAVALEVDAPRFKRELLATIT